MIGMYWRQIRAVIRLEIKKTFFARRGLWIYGVALLPVLLFVAFVVATAHHRQRSAELAQASERRLSVQDLRSIKTGMTQEEVKARLGAPARITHWNEHRWTEDRHRFEIPHQSYSYSDGQNDLYLRMTDGKVESVFLSESENVGQSLIMFAGVFQFFFLRLAVFFGCLGVFMNLFRGEILDRSLHFYFLAPIRREVLIAGKFLAGLLATCVIFVTSELLQTIVFLSHFTPGARDAYLSANHGLGHVAAYLGVTMLACVGYGAFFLVAGILFRNPILPAAAILIWEAINPFLPAVLKQISVIYYLKSLCPIEIPAPPGMPPLLALLVSTSDPLSAPVAVFGLVTVALLALYVSSTRVRRMEINYTTE
jgi:hypothetical protein